MIFPATERTAEVTKLDVVNYHHSVGEGILRALSRRPTTPERWPKGRAPGLAMATRENPRGGDAFFHKRIPRSAPDYAQTARIPSPSQRYADEICPTEVRVVGRAAQIGASPFHPWPLRDDDVDHPDELRIDLDPQSGTDFADAARVADEARALLGELGCTGFPKTSGDRGVHIYVRIEPRSTFTDVHPRRDRLRMRTRAPPAGPGHDQVVERGARRAHLRRLQPEHARPHHRLGVQRAAQAGRAGLRAAGLG